MNAGVIVDNDLINDKRVLREIKIILEDGHRVFVLCFGFKGKTYPDLQDITVTRITISKKLKDILFLIFNSLPVYEWLWAKRIRKFISDNDIAVLHSHDLYMAKCSFSGIRKSRKNVKLVLDLHENFSYQVTSYNWTKGFVRNLLSKPDRWVKKEKEYLGYADRIVVLSEEFRDHLISKYPALKREIFCVLPNVPDVGLMETFKSGDVIIPFKKKAPVLFYFGIIAERRGIFDALTVFSLLVNEGLNLDFLIIGPVDKKDQSRFNKIIGSDDIRNRIIHIPWIDISELPAYLDVSDICVAPFIKNPQHESGVANKIFDYMLGKKPLIVSDCLPQKRLVEKHNCGIAYSNLSEFHDAIIKLCKDPGLRSVMGENGYNAVLTEYNTGKVSGNLSGLYKSVSN